MWKKCLLSGIFNTYKRRLGVRSWRWLLAAATASRWRLALAPHAESHCRATSTSGPTCTADSGSQPYKRSGQIQNTWSWDIASWCNPSADGTLTIICLFDWHRSVILLTESRRPARLAAGHIAIHPLVLQCRPELTVRTSVVGMRHSQQVEAAPARFLAASAADRRRPNRL